jgi:hypothetical protein
MGGQFESRERYPLRVYTSGLRNGRCWKRGIHRYALDPKTSIRVSAGMYYDHFGQGISNAFNASGSFGLASKLSNAMGALRTETSPRFVSRTTLPNLPGAISIGTQNFPFVFPQTNTSTAFLISWAWTTRSKLPTEVYNLSIERALPGDFIFEAAYVGRFGRKLMQQLDLAAPVNLSILSRA